ncbi:MAG: PIN domain-containing protein [Marinilabiliaceae bacterium]|nr:PIN domain-containing protein [Marinilabiliaceae bacterium]
MIPQTKNVSFFGVTPNCAYERPQGYAPTVYLPCTLQSAASWDVGNIWGLCFRGSPELRYRLFGVIYVALYRVLQCRMYGGIALQKGRKFVDCALNAGADFIVTNDHHFNILKSLNFPHVKVFSFFSH